MDHSPAVSPGGTWLAFVSNRSGNTDIWIKKLPRGRAYRLTNHRSDDFMPRWSSDGKSLAFVSRRHDAFGDIWIADLSFSENTARIKSLRQITRFKGMDLSPCWSPDRKHIAFTSSRGGSLDIWTCSLPTGEMKQVTSEGGFNPDWSPGPQNLIMFTSTRKTSGGSLFIIPADSTEYRRARPVHVAESFHSIVSGRWSPSGRFIAFTCRPLDTDNDSRVTPADNGVICIQKSSLADTISFNTPGIQVTGTAHNSTHPAWSDSQTVIFTSNSGANQDIYTVSAAAVTAPAKDASEEYRNILAGLASALSPEDITAVLLSLDALQKRFPGDSVTVSRALVQQGEMYLSLRDTTAAAALFNQAQTAAPANSTQQFRAILKYNVLSGYSLEQKIEQTAAIAEHPHADKGIQAQAYMQQGDLLLEKDNPTGALDALSRVLALYPRPGNLRARALLKIGDIFSYMGQQSLADKQYLTVLSKYNNVPLWRERAGQRLLASVSGTLNQRLTRIRQIIKDTEYAPSLQAQAHLLICKTLADSGRYQQASSELKSTSNLFPGLAWALAESDLMLASVHIARNDELNALFLLEKIEKDHAFTEGGRFALQARTVRFSLLMSTAERLVNSGDFSLAQSRYEQALQIRPDSYDAHRGLVRAAFYNNRLDAVADRYKQQVQTRGTASTYYGYGLALSYLGEKKQALLARSNTLLKQSLESDYEQPYPYLTLSYNYELIENNIAQDDARKPGLLLRAGKFLAYPFTLIRRMFSRRQSDERGYYEMAIEALLTGIEVNDETRNPQLEKMLVQNLANNFYKLGQYGYSKALQYYNRRLDLDTTFVSDTQQAVFFQRAGHCAVFLQDTAYAVPYLTRAAALFRSINRNEQELQTLNYLAFYYYLLQQYEDSLPLYLQIASRFRMLGRYQEAELAYRNLAYNYYLLDEPREVIDNLNNALDMLRHLDPEARLPTNSHIRIEFFGLSIPIWKVSTLGSGLSEGFSYNQEAAFIYGLMSRCKEKLGVLHDAVTYELKRLEIFRNAREKLAQRVCLNRIGVLYLKQGVDAKAWDYCVQAYDQSRKAGDIDGVRMTAMNLGYAALYKVSARWNSETYQYIHALFKNHTKDNTFSRLTDTIEMLNILGCLSAARADSAYYEGTSAEPVSLTMARLSHLEHAVQCFSRALEIAESAEKYELQAALNKNLAEVFLKAGDNAQALIRSHQAESCIRKTGDLRTLWHILFARARILEQIPGTSETQILSLLKQAMDLCMAAPLNQSRPFSLIPVRNELRLLFDKAARIYAGRGKSGAAIACIEARKMRETALSLSLIDPVFKKERHTILWNNYLYSKIRSWKNARQKRNPLLTDPKTESLRRELSAYTRKIQDEDDVLAYFAAAYEFSVQKFQQVLKPKQAGLVFLPCTDSTIVYAVLKDTVITRCCRLGIHDMGIQYHAKAMSQDSIPAAMNIAHSLLAPVHAILDSMSLVILSHSEIFNPIPAALLAHAVSHAASNRPVQLCPSLSYQEMATRRPRINQKTILLLSEANQAPALKPGPGFNFTTISGPAATYSGLQSRFGSSDILILSTRMLCRNTDPFGSMFFLTPDTSSSGPVNIRSLLAHDIEAGIAVLAPSNPVSYNCAYTAAFAMLYCGVPTVIWADRPLDRTDIAAGLDSMLYMLGTNDVLSAFHTACNKQSADFSEGFVFSGFSGFTPEEKKAFANRNIDTRISKALYYYKAQDYTAAKKYLEEALYMAQALKDSAKQNLLYKQLVSVSIKAGLWDSVEKYQRNIIGRTSRAFGNRQTIELSRLVSIFIQAKKYKEAAAVQKSILKRLSGKREREQAMLYLSFLYSRARLFTGSTQWADSAYAAASARQDSMDMAKALLFKGRFLVEADSSLAAALILGRGIAMLEQKADTSAETLKNIASGYQLLGIANEHMGRYHAALESQNKGLALFTRLDMKLQQAQGWQYTANLLWKMGSYSKALEFQTAALKSPLLQNDSNLLAAAYSTRGLIAMDMGNMDAALSWMEKGLATAQKSGNKINQATILKNMGLVSIKQNRLDRAALFFTRALAADSAAAYTRGLAYDMVDMGLLLIEKQNPARAGYYLQRGLETSRAIGDRRIEVKALLGLGTLRHRTGNNENSLALLDTAAHTASSLGTPSFEWRIARQKGLVLRDLKRPEQALFELRNAVAIVEKMRRDLKTEELKQGFFGTKTDLYSDIVSLLIDMGRNKEAFSYAERAQSRSFIDLLGQRPVQLTLEKERLVSRVKSLHEAIDAIQDSIYITAGQQGDTAPALKRLAAEKETAEREFSVRLSQLQRNHPDLASLLFVNPVTLHQIQHMLPDSTGLIKYFTADTRLIIWFITKHQVSVTTKDISRVHLQKLVFTFRENIQSFLSVAELGHALYTVLVKPADKYFADINHLIISTHGSLHYLPFAALMRDNTTYLIDMLPISMIPGVSVLRFSLNSIEATAPDREKVLALGNPHVPSMEALPFAGKEITAISRSFPETDAYTGSAATETRLRQAGLISYGTLHLACHARYDQDNPLESSLFLTADSANDGQLSAREIFSTVINARLVTLSGCETGMNALSPGDEITGFTRSFMFAGTPSIISSLWKVQDLETAVLVKRLYRSLAGGSTKARALRHAQLIVRDMVNSHPAAWAGFTLTGAYQ